MQYWLSLYFLCIHLRIKSENVASLKSSLKNNYYAQGHTKGGYVYSIIGLAPFSLITGWLTYFGGLCYNFILDTLNED